MNEPNSQPPPEAAREAVDDQGRLIDDVACRRCGYNLRSLETDGVCPECGAAVTISIHGYYLRFAPSGWVRRLALGAKLLIASIVTAIVGWLTMMGIGIAMAISMSTATATSPSQTVFAAGPSSTLQSIMSASVIGLSLLVTAMLIVGIIFLTARDPAEIGKPERFGSRRLVRYCLWPIPVATIGGAIMSGLQNTTNWWAMNPLVITLLSVVGIASVASYLIMPAAMLRRFMGLMKRIPRAGLVRFAKIEFWAYLVVSVLGFGLYAVAFGVFFRVAPTAFAAAATTTAPTAAARLSQLGYVGGPSSAPAVTTGPSGAAGSSVTTSSFQSGTRVTVTGPGLTSMPATLSFAPTARSMSFAIIAAFSGVAGCGGIGVGIAGLVLLIMSWRALAAAAGQAKDNSAATSRAAAPPA